MKYNDMFDKDDNPKGGPIFTNMLVWSIGTLFLFGILGMLIWGAETGWTFATQKVNMQKEAYQQTFNGSNKLASDKSFNDLYNTIVASGNQIKIQETALEQFKKDNPNFSSNIMLSQQYGQMVGNLSGARQMLQSEVSEYNTKSNALLNKNFLP